MDRDLINQEERLFEILLRSLEDGNKDEVRKNAEMTEALLLMHDTETSLRCDNMPEVDIEEELRRTRSKLSLGIPMAPPAPTLGKSRYRTVAYLCGGIGIGAVATLVILFSLGFFSIRPIFEREPAVILYSAVDEPQDVLFTHYEVNGPIQQPKAINSDKKTHLTDNLADVLDIREEGSEKQEDCTVTTPVGKTMKIILDDGTRVLLSPESTLRFPMHFTGEKRNVELEGEAYFDVAKDQDHPFTVTSQEFCTTALGTEFDVKAYSRADVKVSLIEGSVHVENLLDQSSVVLQPGEDVRSVDGKLVVSSVDMKAFKFWRDGYFYFDDTPLADMMIELGRWYNVTVEFSTRSLFSYRLHFVSGRDENIRDVVKRLNKFNYLDVLLDGNTIRIDERK